ncbi:MAG: hypothetical protein DWQ47_15895 [Acidobacteria bacterium]|nr:MAG: hypothetical protein DWQ32_03295 [Acidobacteriota bacterium]REK02460.1 MAG: hypothetical protein DWQ38_08840 [Acidobacteriota bacterium]REK13738.1 MAG: hypothetical protein DWQ43_08985 [Acidobacteriota bacterium]REK41732.1 MAG: hypothetical protein DWQ47_15895 [Acidobacteriota bacterium]
MKTCPKCGREYEDLSLNFCLDDGEWLVEEGTEAPTRSIPPDLTDDPGEAPTKHKISKTDETEVLHTRAIKDDSDIRGRRSSLLYVIAGLAAAAVLGIGAFGLYVWAPFFSDRTETISIAEITAERLTGEGSVWDAAISPDGKFLALLNVEGNEKSLQVKQIETNSTVEILKAGDFQYIDNVVFSPDGNFIFFTGIDPDKRLAIYRVPTLGGSMLTIPVASRAFSLSPDGSQIAYSEGNPKTTETSITVSKADGTEPRRLVTKVGKQWIDPGNSWSPDGKRLLFLQGDDDRLPNPLLSLAIYSFEDDSVSNLGTGQWDGIDPRGIVWDPTGDFVYLTGNRIGGEPSQVYRVSVPGGEAVRITQSNSNYWGLSITSDGSRLVTTEEVLKTAIWVSQDLDPMESTEVFPAKGDTWSLDWTPDGRIVYVSDQSGAREVWVMNDDGSNQKQLTNDRIPKSSPAVSPDGRTVVYSSPVEGFQIYKVSIDGGNPARINTGVVGPGEPVFSSDGKYIAFSAWPAGKQSIFRMPAEGGRAERLTDYFSSAPTYSPDGSMIACFFIDEKDQFMSLGIIPAGGGTPIKKFSIPANTISRRGTLWTPDGKSITYLVADGEKVDLWAQPVTAGDPVRLTDFDLPWIQRRAYSRDGKRIAITRGESLRNAVMLKLAG